MAHGDWKDMIAGVQKNDLELVQYYIRMGIDINYQHPEFMTSALMECIRCGHKDMLVLLLENGANPNLKEAFSGDSPLKLAMRLNRKELINMLSKYGVE